MFYLVWIIFIILSIYSVRLSKNARSILVIQSLCLFILSAFRYGIGADYFAYKYLFSKTLPLFAEGFLTTGSQEIGYQFLESAFATLGISYQIFLVVFALITIIYVSRVCLDFSPYPIVSFTLFFSIYSTVWLLSGIRQGVVIFVGLYYFIAAIRYNTKESIFKLVVACVILALLHSTSFVYLLLFLMSYIVLNRRKQIILIILSYLFSLIPMIPLLKQLTWIPYYERLLPYLHTEIGFELMDFQSFARLVIWSCLIIFYNDAFSTHKLYRRLFNVYTYSLVLYFILKSSELVAARISVYGKTLEIVLLAQIIYHVVCSDNVKKWFIGVVTSSIILFSLAYYGKELKTMQHQSGLQTESFFVPYVSIFDQTTYVFINTYKDYLEINSYAEMPTD